LPFDERGESGEGGKDGEGRVRERPCGERWGLEGLASEGRVAARLGDVPRDEAGVDGAEGTDETIEVNDICRGRRRRGRWGRAGVVGSRTRRLKGDMVVGTGGGGG
jgi:hypothetical protein